MRLVMGLRCRDVLLHWFTATILCAACLCATLWIAAIGLAGAFFWLVGGVGVNTGAELSGLYTGAGFRGLGGDIWFVLAGGVATAGIAGAVWLVGGAGAYEVQVSMQVRARRFLMVSFSLLCMNVPCSLCVLLPT